jgi:hypothetical protein
VGFGPAAHICRTFKIAESARTFGVHDALGNALAVKMGIFFQQVEILQQHMATGTDREGILVVANRHTRRGGQGRTVAHDGLLLTHNEN